MTTVVSILSQYSGHSNAPGANDSGSESNHSLPMSWCHGYQRFVCTGDSDNGSERCKTFPEKLVWRDVDDDNSSELSSLITIVMSGHPAMTTVVTASLNTVVIKLNRIL